MQDIWQNNLLLLKLWWSLIAPKGTLEFRHERLEKISIILEWLPHTKKIILNGTWHFWHWAVNQYGVNECSYMKIQSVLFTYFSLVDKYFPKFTRVSGKWIYENDCDLNVFNEHNNIITAWSITHNMPLSSEKIYSILLRKFQPKITYMLTDVAWIFNKEWNVIPIINKENLNSLHFYEKKWDASWWMKEKIEQLQTVWKEFHWKTWVIDGNNIENILEVINNDRWIGTQVYF